MIGEDLIGGELFLSELIRESRSLLPLQKPVPVSNAQGLVSQSDPESQFRFGDSISDGRPELGEHLCSVTHMSLLLRMFITRKRELRGHSW